MFVDAVSNNDKRRTVWLINSEQEGVLKKTVVA
jgi:hypothetical protein